MLGTLPGLGSRDSALATTEVVADYSAFLRLEAEWNDAVARAQISHPFLRHEWIRTWWDSFGPSTRAARSGQANRELHIIVVRDEGRIIAIAPLMRERAPAYGLPVRRLALLANDHTPRTDFVIAGKPDEAYRAIWNALLRDIDQWDVLQLTQLLRASTTVAVMSQFATAEGLPIGVWKSSDSPYLELAGTWDSYWASLPSKFRSNVRNGTGCLG